MQMFEFYEYPPHWFTDEIDMLLCEELREAIKAMSDQMIEV